MPKIYYFSFGEVLFLDGMDAIYGSLPVLQI
jgi:hypothetical protein